MNQWKFFDVTHRKHILCNPMSVEKIDRLIALLHMEPAARVVDIACGKGEFLIRLAERYPRISGLGIDSSPFCIADVRKKHHDRLPGASLRFLEMNGADFSGDSERFDLVACIGASWIFGGHRGTLKALCTLAAPRSWIIVGEPFWMCEPDAAYLAAIDEKRENYGSHADNADAGREQGLELVFSIVSSRDDWDVYEGLQWYAAEAWADSHPDDPDVETVLQRVRNGKAAYLRWGRETLGWAIYVFRTGGRAW
ncbi:class I SAM-dependent methyltransferase [bacterium]|nr:class I SAM-dependent methyltransferase [candidate division CSSED10-310 bacterium]